MKTNPFRLAARCVALLAAMFSTQSAIAFTAKELAQGYSDTEINAMPKDSHAATIDSEEASAGIRVRRRFPHLGGIRQVVVPSGETVDHMIARLRATGRYRFVERSVLRYPLVTPNDASFSLQWSLKNTGQNSGTSGADIGATTAWDSLTDTSSVIVAVVDTGALLTHEDLASNLWTSSTNTHGINAFYTSGPNYTNPTDTSSVGHGTHVSGIIGAAGNNHVGIAGVAWKAKIMELKFLGDAGTDGDEAACIDYAIQNGAQIINASYGGGNSTQTELWALERARAANIIVVAAAGNDSVNNDVVPSYPASYQLDNVVTVAATDRDDQLDTSYSNYGSGSVDLAAPGSEIYSLSNTNNQAYQILSGTSMAAPHVTGVLAYLRAKFPGETYRQTINRLLRAVTKLPGLSGKVQAGGRVSLANAIASTGNRPFNDDFADRAVLAGPNVQVRSNNVGATLEGGEPAHAGVTTGASLWWSWTAPYTGLVTFDTGGSNTEPDTHNNSTPLDTVLAVYAGDALGNLVSVGANDDTVGRITSQVQIQATAGTTYQIAVAGKNGVAGYIALHIGAVPPNDNFGSAQVLTGNSVSVSGSLLNASQESAEPNPTGLAAGHSVWYKWIAPDSGHYLLAAFATQTDTVAAVYTGSSLGSLTVVGSDDNNPTNSYNSDALVSFNAVAGTTYYFQIDDNASSGGIGADIVVTLTEAAWVYSANDQITSSPAVGSDGTIYVGAGSADGFDTSLYAINPDGTRKWSYSTSTSNFGTGIMDASPAIGPDGTVYVGATDHILYAINGSTGILKWSYPSATTAITSTPAIGSDGTIYFRDDAYLYALTTAGTQKWSFFLSTAPATGGSYASPTIASDGTIYVGTTGAKFYAVNSDGTQKWSYTTDDGGDVYTTAAIATDGSVYFATLNGTVYALSSTGSLKWKWATANQSSVSSSIALGADGTLYFAGYDHKVHALSSSGTERWSYTMGDEVRASSPAVATDGSIYVGCYDGFVYALNADGTLRQTYATAQQVRSSPAIANNRLYIGGEDAKLYAIDLGLTAANSAWPMSHQNAAHLGRAVTPSLAISAQPVAQAVAQGSALTLSVTATSSSSISYQWYKDGVAISGATGATYSVASTATTDSGSYTVLVSDTNGGLFSSSAYVIVTAVGTSSTHFVDIATRAYCSTGNNVTIGGFVVSGTTAKHYLIRAVGPSLTAQGLSAAEVLQDPTISVHHGASVIATNDNWGDNTNAADITFVASQVGATALQASDTTSSELLLTLQPGIYSFVVNGKNSTSGIVLIEVYDADTAGTGANFVNISSRAYSSTGNNVAIGGFVIGGTQPKLVLLRAVGPTLTTQGIGQSEVLLDPTIELHDALHGNVVIGTNDNWGDNTNASDIVTTAARIGATPFADTDTASSALLLTLQPGVYSFIAKGVGNTSGIVLVEVYDAD